MFQEPKILPWLARKAGVSLPEAREIWRMIASEADAHGAEGEDVAWQVVRELRQQLRERGRSDHRGVGTQRAAQVDWMFAAPYLRAWAVYQTRLYLDLWLAWARAGRPA